MRVYSRRLLDEQGNGEYTEYRGDLATDVEVQVRLLGRFDRAGRRHRLADSVQAGGRQPGGVVVGDPGPTNQAIATQLAMTTALTIDLRLVSTRRAPGVNTAIAFCAPRPAVWTNAVSGRDVGGE
jgi:hypothetical protein